MYKILFLSLIVVFVSSGCSTKDSKYLYKNKNNFFKEKWLEKNEVNLSIKDEVLAMDKEFFNNTSELDHTVLHVNETFIEEDPLEDNDIVYISAVNGYKHVLEFKSIEDINMKSYDYLKLYKALKINEPNLFLKLKKDIINKFMVEISYLDYLDTKKILEVLKKENLSKINKLIKILKEKDNE